jgi:TatD DNase family protein
MTPARSRTGRRARLIDIGANLAHDSFDQDREAVLARAAAAGVDTVIVTGSSKRSSLDALDLCRQFPGRLFSTAGVHPHHAGDWSADDRAWILDLSKQSEVVAIGECGLDYFRNFSSHDDQESAFRAQLGIGADTGMPMFLHQRDAHEAFTEIVAEYLPRLSRAVAHCFTGGRAELNDYLDMGLYIGITGWICDERRGHHLRDLVASIPADRLLLETDAPYLLPRDVTPRPSSRRNEPAFLRHVAETVAGCIGKSPDQLAEETRENAIRFFGLNSINIELE